jgi:integrase
VSRGKPAGNAAALYIGIGTGGGAGDLIALGVMWSPGRAAPAPIAGGVGDPSNTLKMMRQAFKHAGFDGVTSHYFRKTVATLMDEAGLSARSAADQLGHATPSLTADLYMGGRKRATGPAEVLEDLFQP